MIADSTTLLSSFPVPARDLCVRIVLWVGVTVSCSVSSAQAQTVHHVRASLATGANDGTSWSNAFRGPLAVRTALAIAAPGDEVWVALGTYVPAPVGQPGVSFDLSNGVALYGGFQGNETLRTQRSPTSHPTILSGDLAGNGSAAGTQSNDNSFHVVAATSVDSSAVLDGFTITGGYARCCASVSEGGGIRIVDASPVIRGCTFTRNVSEVRGGDVCVNGGSPLFESCQFTGGSGSRLGTCIAQTGTSSSTVRRCLFTGTPDVGGGPRGVGIHSDSTSPVPLLVEDCQFSITCPPFVCAAGVGILADQGSQLIVKRSQFIGNTSCGGGGGIHCDGVGVIDRCVFMGNEGQFDGGAALYTATGHVTVSNCVINGNDRAGFSTLLAHGTMVLVNCTIVNNGSLGGPLGGGHSVIVSSAPGTRFANCIIFSNESTANPTDAVNAPLSGGAQRPTFDNCLVQGWNGSLPGTGSFAADPRFLLPSGSDGIAGNADDDLRLRKHSPCIDRGFNLALPLYARALDFGGRRRIVDDASVVDFFPSGRPTVDLGALEYSNLFVH